MAAEERVQEGSRERGEGGGIRQAHAEKEGRKERGRKPAGSGSTPPLEKPMHQ